VEYLIVYNVVADAPNDDNCPSGFCVLQTASAAIIGTSVQTLNPSDDVSQYQAPITRKIKYNLKKTGPAFIPLSNTFTYTITITNSGPSEYPGTFGDDLDPVIAPTDGSVSKLRILTSTRS